MTQREIDHTADVSKKVNVDDCISRKAAIDAIKAARIEDDGTYNWRTQRNLDLKFAEEILETVPFAQPDNQINLCDSCDCSYPDCPSKYDDVIFGNGIGNDNICACNKYKPSAQPERKMGKWIYNSPVTMKCNQCGFVIKDWDWHRFKFCPNCDCDMRGEQK